MGSHHSRPIKRPTLVPTRHASEQGCGGNFRFLDLPAELQNAVYEYALTVPEEHLLNGKKRECTIRDSNTAITLRCNIDRPRHNVEPFTECSCNTYADYPCPRHYARLHPAQALAAGLLRVCRKTYKECAPLLYSRNAFKMDTPTLQRFLLRIGLVNASYLRRLCILDFFRIADMMDATNNLEKIMRGFDKEYRFPEEHYHPYFAPRYFQLAAAVNLDTLELPIIYSPEFLSATGAAEYLIGQLYMWIEACAAKDGRADACLSRVKLTRKEGCNRVLHRWYNHLIVKELRELLGV